MSERMMMLPRTDRMDRHPVYIYYRVREANRTSYCKYCGRTISVDTTFAISAEMRLVE